VRNSLIPLVETGNVVNQPEEKRHFLVALSREPFADISFAQNYTDQEVSLVAYTFSKDSASTLLRSIANASRLTFRPPRISFFEDVEETLPVWDSTYSQLATLAPTAEATRKIVAASSHLNFLGRYTNTSREKIDEIAKETMKLFKK